MKRIANDYFDFLARNFPVMCACDEFYFFPRVTSSIRYLDRLDSLDQDKIQGQIRYAKDLQSQLDKLTLKKLDLEAEIDLTLLKQNIATFIREFDHIKSWASDPSLYLKITTFAIDQILYHATYTKLNTNDLLIKRMRELPLLLAQAKQNLINVPSLYRESSLKMNSSTISYLKGLNLPCLKTRALKRKVLQSLDDFQRFLVNLKPKNRKLADSKLLKSVLIDSYSYKRELKDIFEIANQEYRQTIKELKSTARLLKPAKSWQEILSQYNLTVKDEKGLLKLYIEETKRIKAFLKKKNIISLPKTQDVQIKLTPLFMQPLRAAASYSSPLTNNLKEPAYFYITALNQIHKEYIFITAHETYPGHHLLDAVRRKNKNPIRNQIESPLFYEGWASYSESLIYELGYTKDQREKMLMLKRQAWRCIRAMLDVGTKTNQLKANQAEVLLKDLGYPIRLVKPMLKHYLLTTGYQLCYTIGKFEIEKLKNSFVQKLGLKKFHDLLLTGGQIPFELIAKRMQACLKNS